MIDRKANCPLCGRVESGLRESIRIRDLASLYRGKLAIEVGTEFAACKADTIDVLRCSACGLEYCSPAVAGSTAFYERLQLLDLYYQHEKPEFAFARSLIGPSDRVLEIGAGAGAFACRLACASYTGLEYSPAAIARAASAGVMLSADDLQEHASRHASGYTVACAFQVLEHVVEPGRFVQNMRHAVAPGGRLILSVPSADSFLSAQTNNPLNLPPHHLTWWPDRAFEALARSFDLTLENVVHHPLEPSHVDAFVHASLLNPRHLCGRKVDLRASFRLRQRLAGALVPLARWRFARAASLARGESVTAVFRRP